MSNSDSKKYLNLDGLRTFWSKIKIILDDINSYLDFLKSTNVLTSLSRISPNTRLYIADITTNQSLSFASKPAAGRDIHIIIRNVSLNDLTITMPTSTDVVLLCNPNYTLSSNEYLEVNVISDGSIMYFRVA